MLLFETLFFDSFSFPFNVKLLFELENFSFPKFIIEGLYGFNGS